MLEFREGFFEQEIRNGFYLDTTMKTVWASGIEVLQKIAEICDRYGFTWYAAYGTLLGAVRHEGFVPWDDDFDIWLLRKDYNKLMEVLPKELPEGYLARSPLTDVGYNQFHSWISNGDGISIKKEWLEQFHGCPFTVGVDIFPLDYLPRNERDRELQVKLLLLAGRIAQMARTLDQGRLEELCDEDTDKEEALKNPDKIKQKAKEEMEEGIEYLEKNCKFSINRQLFEEEQWYMFSSEMWKWANYIAMMYGEKESDYLVYYVNYTERENKKFPKEWFDGVYGAEFEDFMLPVPVGYDQILKRIYGDYVICIRKTSSHDYPFYAVQLRLLREYLQDKEKKAEELGLIKPGDIREEEDFKEIPAQWLSKVLKEDGTRKKLVLSANDPTHFMANGQKALDVLEDTLKVFEAKRDRFTFWWRPYPAMGERLDQVSPELGERYRQILNRYKSQGWGICDETQRQECAVENCDVYYGDMNAIMQPFQNNDKPIMLTHLNRERVCPNITDKYMENYIYFSCPGFVMDENKVYFSNTAFNALVIVDRKTGAVESMTPFIERDLKAKELHLKCCRLGNKIYFLPTGTGMIHVYNTETGEQEAYGLEGGYGEDVRYAPWNFHIWRDEIYLLPSGGGMGLWKFGRDGQLSREEWWEAPFYDKYYWHGSMDDKSFFSLEVLRRNLTITNLERHETRSYELPDKRVFRIAYDGSDFWYVGCDTADVVRWNPGKGETARYRLPMWEKCNWAGMPFSAIHAEEKEIFLVSGDGKELFLLDKEKGNLAKVFEMSGLPSIYTTMNKESLFCRVENKLIWLQGIGEAAEIDLQTLEGKMLQNVLPFDKKTKDYFDKVLFDKAPIFAEGSDWTLEKFLDHCENSTKQK